jgi:hypothetical protein
MVVPLPARSDSDDDDTFQSVTRVAREFAELISEVSEVTADGAVSDNELRRVDTEATELVAAIQAVLTTLRLRNERSRPKTFREVC